MMVADNSGMADIPRGAHTLVLEDNPSVGARKQEEEADDQSWRAHTQQMKVHKLLPPVVRNREHCLVVVGIADHPCHVGLNNCHNAAGNTIRTGSRMVPAEAWSCSLRKHGDSMDPPAAGHVADTLVVAHGHHSVAVMACIADLVHCLFCSPEASAHMDLKDAAVGVQPALGVASILQAASQTPKILMNIHSFPSLEYQCAFAVLDGVPPVVHHGSHRAGGPHRPNVPLGVCQP